MRILYVEDNPANLSLMLRIARAGNHEIVSYVQGEEALANYEHDQPDIVLLDLQLAGQLSGMDVMQALRSQGVKSPMIAVTAYAMVGDKERCLDAGFTEYMAKPLQVSELVEKLQRYEGQLAAQATVLLDEPIAASSTEMSATTLSTSARPTRSVTGKTTAETESALPSIKAAASASATVGPTKVLNSVTPSTRSTSEYAAIVLNAPVSQTNDTVALANSFHLMVSPLGGSAMPPLVSLL